MVATKARRTADAVQQQVGIPLEIAERSDNVKGLVLRKRCIAERTYAWLGLRRRLAKDYEKRTRSHFRFILVIIPRMLRRIVRHAGAT